MRHEFTAIMEPASEGRYFADCPTISGANGQGQTLEEFRQNLVETMALIIEKNESPKSDFALRNRIFKFEPISLN